MLFLDSPIQYGARLALSGNSQIQDSLGRVPCDETESVGLIHKEPLSALSVCLKSCIFISGRASAQYLISLLLKE